MIVADEKGVARVQIVYQTISQGSRQNVLASSVCLSFATKR